MNHQNNIENEIKNSIEIILKPFTNATETKNHKLFGYILSLIKKLLNNNLIKQNFTCKIIIILKEILEHSSEEFIQIKVIELLIPLINPNIINLTEDNINNVNIFFFII